MNFFRKKIKLIEFHFCEKLKTETAKRIQSMPEYFLHNKQK